MKVPGIKGDVHINLVAVEAMDQSTFIKKMKPQLADPKGAYKACLAQIKKEKDEEEAEAKAESEAKKDEKPKLV